MEYENIDYVDALKRLAERYGIQIEWDKGGDDFQKGEIGLLYELHEIAQAYYQKQLYSATGRQALEYLESRGFDKNVLKKFSVGYASDSWNGLFNQLDLKKYGPKALEKSGLFIKKEDRFLDRFRNRIMFPITNVSGRVVAFGGRALDPKEDAKYMNSPETPIYFKSGTLYGLEHSKRAIQQEKEAILVEGYTDVMRFYSSGIKNVIAGSGTALNFHHARALKRFTSKTVLCYDGDDAGQKATERAGFTFLKEGFDVRAIRLPADEDPDSYIKNHSVVEFQKIYREAPEFISYYIRNHQEELKSPASKTNFIDQIINEISEVHHPVTRDFIIKELADKLGLREERIIAQIRRKFQQKHTGTSTAKKEKPSGLPELQINTVLEKAEFELLKLIFADDDEITRFIVENIPLAVYKHSVLKAIAGELYKRIQKGEDTSPAGLFNQEWSDEERFYLSKIIIEAESAGDFLNQEDMMKLTIDCMAVLMTDQLEQAIKALRVEIKEAEKKQEDTLPLIKELSRLQKKRHDIRAQLRKK
jgi:DNA primase